jgi:hypothetical protein
MLDNHDPQQLLEPSKYLKEKFPHSLIEASGIVLSLFVAFAVVYC